MRNKHLWWLLAAFFTILIYYPGLSGPFLLDDESSVKPAHINNFTLPEFLTKTFDNTSGPLGRPIAIATFILNDYFWGPSPFSYKVTNLTIHILIGGLLFIWLRQLCRHLKLSESIPLLISILWMIHPMQVSTALYPVQRMTQLSSLFMILGCLGYTSTRLRQFSEQKNMLMLYGSAFIYFPLALFSKENGILLSVYYLCIEHFIFRWQFKSTEQRRSISLFMILFSFIPCMATMGYVTFHWDRYLALYHTQLFSLESRLLTQPIVLLFYIKELLIPRLSELGLFLDDFPVYKTFGIIPGLALCTHVILLAFLCYKPKKYPLLPFSIAWFYASHLLESTALPLEMAFEHRNYLASLGIFIPLAQLFSLRNQSTIVRPNLLYACMAAYLFLLGYLTFLRAQTWSQIGLFLSVEVDEHPKSARAHVFWANYLIKNELFELALEHLNLAEKISPHNLGAKVHQLIVYCNHPSPPNDLIERVLKGAHKDIITAYAISSLDFLANREMHEKCPSVSRETFLTIMQLASENPNLQAQKEWLSSVYTDQAVGYMLLERYDEAIIWLDKSFKLYPKRLTPIFYKVEYQINTHHFKDAHKTIEQLKDLKISRPNALSYTLPWAEERLRLEESRAAQGIQIPLKTE